MITFAGEYSDTVQVFRSDLKHLDHCISAGQEGIPDVIGYEKMIENSSSAEPDIDVSDDDAVVIIHTSGTTGNPKGAVITQKNLITMSFTCFYHGIASGSRLVVFPLFHMAGFCSFHNAIYFGHKIVLTDNTDVEHIMKTVQKEKIEHLGLPPVLWNGLFNHQNYSKYDLSSLKWCGTGGAPMALSLKKQIIECLPNVILWEHFGQTEATGIALCANTEDLIKKHGSVGRVSYFMEARVVDDNDNDVEPGEMGEIVYRGPSIMREYWEDPDATSVAFKNGWFHSGDLVKQDEDGYIYIVDRKKDIIISGGENISAWEVENALSSHPDILEASVIGVPDEKWGESVKAFVMLRPDKKISEDDVISFCKGKIASYKKPRYVEFVKEFPRTPSGKVKKFILREKNSHSGLPNG